MKTLAISRVVLAAAGLALAGCASAKLQIESAIYSEEPAETAILTAEERLQLQTGIDAAEEAAQDIQESRIDLTAQLTETVINYRRFIDFVVFAKTPSDNAQPLGTEFIRSDHEEFLAELSSQREAVDAAVARAREALAKYNEAVDKLFAGETSRRGELGVIRDRLDGALIALRQELARLGSDLGTAYEADMREFVINAPASLSDESLRALTSDDIVALAPRAKDLAQQFRSLASELERLEQKGYSFDEALPNRLRTAARELDDLTGGQANQLEGIKTASGVFVGVGSSTGLGDDGKRAIKLLGVSLNLYLSQIDRLQNAADPVWREITDPANEEKWNSVFSRTLFYAEGDTSVIIVRDRPGHYRVMQGKNNPTALVQGQLRITRTIAAGLTEVLAATTGAAGLSGLLPGGGAGGTGGDGSAGKTDSPTLAASDATVRAEAQRRQNIRTNLLRNLERLENELEALPSDDPRVADLTNQLKAILEGHGPLLKPQ